MKRPSKKTLLIAGIALALVLVFTVVGSAMSASRLPVAQTVALSPMNLSSTVAATGTVESATDANVYSTLTYSVKELLVKEGDKVREGDVLCKLDTDNLELDIAQKKAMMNQSSSSSQVQLEQNQQRLDNAQYNLDHGLNSQIVAAQSAVESARVNRQNARDSRDSLESKLSSAREAKEAAKTALAAANATTVAAEEKVGLAQSAIDSAASGTDTTALEQELALAKQELLTAQANQKIAMSASQTAETSHNTLSSSYEQAVGAVDSADVAYNNALNQLDAAENSALQEIESYKKNVKASQVASDNSADKVALEKLQKQLDDASIKAPMDGTVTAVYAKEGSAGSGLLFVVENTDGLQISTTIKEYDIEAVSTGMRVIVKTDATGDEEFEGTLREINPTAVKAPDGSVQQGNTDVEFEAKVSLKKADALKVGMSARLSIVLQEKHDVFGVPYDAVIEKEDGSFAVMTAKADGKSFVLEEIPVSLGMETDFYQQITAQALANGMKIVTNPDELQGKTHVKLEDSAL